MKKIAIEYKLNWLEYPLIVLGTTDRQNKFHPLLYACTTTETTNDYSFVFESLKRGIEIFLEENFEPTTLIADGADAIRNAFYYTFEPAEKDIMCVVHVYRNVNKRKFATTTNKPLILDDLKKMQSASNRQVFNMMSKLFIEKWRNEEVEFIEYFEKQWLGVHSNWFEGAAEITPSTNNGVESHNASIKSSINLSHQ